MPSLADHQSGRSTKLLLLGESGHGKTGALTSLVKDGYKLRIIDMDNGLDSLKQFVKKDCPSAAPSAIQFQTYRDAITSYQGDRPVYKGLPDAFSRAMKALDKWPDDGTSPKEWDEKTILVLDSLTHFGNAAFAWARAMSPSAKEPRQWFYTAQQAVETTIALLTSEAFQPNVIVTAHITYEQMEEGVTRGFPTSIGRALGPKLVSYFNNVAQVQQTGAGANVKRSITTAPTALITLKNPAPFSMAPSLPIESGLATFFKTVRA